MDTYFIITVSGKKIPFPFEDAMNIATTVYNRDFNQDSDTLEDVLSCIDHRFGFYYVTRLEKENGIDSWKYINDGYYLTEEESNRVIHDIFKTAFVKLL